MNSTSITLTLFALLILIAVADVFRLLFTGYRGIRAVKRGLFGGPEPKKDK